MNTFVFKGFPALVRTLLYESVTVLVLTGLGRVARRLLLLVSRRVRVRGRISITAVVMTTAAAVALQRPLQAPHRHAARRNILPGH